MRARPPRRARAVAWRERLARAQRLRAHEVEAEVEVAEREPVLAAPGARPTPRACHVSPARPQPRSTSFSPASA